MWTSGLTLFAGSFSRKDTIKRVLTHPCILACILGFIMTVTGLALPQIILDPIRYIGRSNTALSMLLIGMILSRINLKQLWDKTIMIYCLHRLLLMPLFFFLLIRLLPVSPEVLRLSVLLTAMPAGATTSILAEKYQMEPEFATKMVIISTLLSLPSIFLWSMFLMR